VWLVSRVALFLALLGIAVVLSEARLGRGEPHCGFSPSIASRHNVSWCGDLDQLTKAQMIDGHPSRVKGGPRGGDGRGVNAMQAKAKSEDVMRRVIIGLILLAPSLAHTQTLIVPRPGGHAGPLDADETAVVRVDEDYRLAKLRNDLDALRRVLADDFYEMNQNGHGRNKTQTIELWQTFRITSLTTDEGEVRVTGDTAVMSGRQTEVNGSGTDRMRFMRTFIRRHDQRDWQLLSSIQFRDPGTFSAVSRR